MSEMSIMNNKAFSVSSNTDTSSDPIRGEIKSYWIYDGNTLVYDAKNTYTNKVDKDGKPSKSAFGNSLNFDFSPKTPEKIEISLDLDTSLVIKAPKSLVEITPRYGESLGIKKSGGNSINGPESVFDSYIENSVIPYIDLLTLDYKLDLNAPIEYASAVQNHSALAGTVNFVYNYGLGIYENQTNLNSVGEAQMNNFYKFLPIPDIEPVGTLASSIISVPLSAPFTKQNVSKQLLSQPLSTENIQDFFMNSDGFIQALDIQERKDTFPFYNEIYLTNPPDTLGEDDPIKESLKNNGLLMAFCDLMNREDYKFSQEGEETTVVQDVSFTNSYIASSYLTEKQEQFREFSALKIELIKLYDIPQMLQIMYKAIPKGTAVSKDSVADRAPINSVDTRTLRSKAFLTNGEEAEYRLDTISKIKPLINTSINYEAALDDLVKTINELLTNFDNYRSYTNILDNNKELYQSDVLFYRIKKFEQGSDTPIQNFWIPAEKGYRGVRYIDTQVKYGKMYRYEVCAFKFVIGTEYRFDDTDVGVVSFEEELKNYVEEIEEPIQSMIGLGLIRGVYEESYSEFPDALPGFSPDFKDKIVDQQTTIALAETVDQNQLFSREMVKVNSGSKIDIAAQVVLSGGNIPGSEVNLSMLTEEEKQAFQNIRSSWECLSNTNGTGFGTLAKIEVAARNIKVLGQIEAIIIQELTDEKKRNSRLKAWIIGIVATVALVTASIITFGAAAIAAAGAAATAASAATALAGSIVASSAAAAAAVTATAATAAIGTAIGTTVGAAALGISAGAITASAESKKSNQTGLTVDNLELNDIERVYTKINALTSIPLPFLNSSSQKQLLESSGVYFIDFPDDPQTFDIDNVDVPRLNTGLVKFDDSFSLDASASAAELASGASERKAYLQKKREELKQIGNLLAKETKKLESLVQTFNGCYVDFIESARSINIAEDYKRINKYKLVATATPTVKFAELPYFRSEGMILDNPPIYPNVNVITYRGVPDKLSFFMNSGQGQIEVKPTTFSEAEDEFIANYRKSRKLNDFQPILYKSDETENLGTIFEIRRLSSPPQSLKSFTDAKVSTTTQTIRTGKTLPAATFDEIIESNKSYYYIFRVFDRRGTPSYPSSIMEIQIVENSGIIYPVIKPYEPSNPELNVTKNLKRLLNIVPRITQILPPADMESFDKVSTDATTVLGSEEEGLFGKQFKLRLTSKQTGKVVDLNLNFKAEVVETADME